MSAEALDRVALEAAFDRVEDAVLDFACGNEASLAPDSWTRSDVVGHLTGWLEFSGGKLGCIASGRPFADVADLEAFNEALYQRYRGHDMDTVRVAFQTALADYRAVLSLFSEQDLRRSDLPTGFGFELWKYLLMDGVVHPVQHLLYQSLKEGDQARFARLKAEFHPEFAAFTPDLEAFELRDFPPVAAPCSETES